MIVFIKPTTVGRKGLIINVFEFCFMNFMNFWNFMNVRILALSRFCKYSWLIGDGFFKLIFCLLDYVLFFVDFIWCDWLIDWLPVLTKSTAGDWNIWWSSRWLLVHADLQLVAERGGGALHEDPDADGPHGALRALHLVPA